MEKLKSIRQILRKNVKDEYEKAERYFSIISVINDLNLTSREIQLIAFTAIKGNISYANYKEEFVKKYNSSLATVGNIVCKLKKMKVFVKDGDKVKVNPVLKLDFNLQLLLEINIV